MLTWLESHNIAKVLTEYTYDMSLNEIYDEVCAILGDTIGDHILTKVEGVFEAEDDHLTYDSLVLYFERDEEGN